MAAGGNDLIITARCGSPVLIDPAAASIAAGPMVSAFTTGAGIKPSFGTCALPAASAGEPRALHPDFGHVFEPVLLRPPER